LGENKMQHCQDVPDQLAGCLTPFFSTRGGTLWTGKLLPQVGKKLAAALKEG
jgi:hypothetical protein